MSPIAVHRSAAPSRPGSLRVLWGIVLAITAAVGSTQAAPPPGLRLESLELSDHRGRSWTLAEFLVGEAGGSLKAELQREAEDRLKAELQREVEDRLKAELQREVEDRLKPELQRAEVQLGEVGPGKVLVVAFLGTDCPLAKLYATRLSEIAEQYAERGVRVVGVISNRQDSLQKIAAFVERQQVSFPVLKDPRNRFADALGAERTPEVFLFDQQRQLRYWGRVDDRYGIGYARDQANREDLREAIDEVLAGRSVSVARTRSVGCIIGRTKPTDPEADVTYVGSVAAILHRRCVECHRDGEIAPFSLEDPDEVTGWADMIAEVVREQRMPPWHASPEHGDFANDRSLTAAEKETLYAWAEAGAPLGDLARARDPLPPLPEKPSGWQLPRQPDLVVEVSPQPFPVPATGAVQYQYFKVDPGLEEDVWLEAAELLPGNRAVVHHILAFTRPRGSQGGLNGARSFLVGYVPGARSDAWPAGMAKRIPGGSELIFQVHYTPIGTPQQDHSKLGLCFADPATITHEVHTSSALQTNFEIPPGAEHHVVTGTSPVLEVNGLLLGMSPHMHVRGKAFRYELIRRDGSRRILLDIPQYDFNWQTTYLLREPLPLRPGDQMYCTAVYDNSSKNLNNPDPTKTVRWGDQTWEEMMIGYVHFAVPLPGRAANEEHDDTPH